ncbi:hypothetical protein Patl1_20086 [Pistacia atlantica]|uniref:Uncharacterized protein n=1 Tax=Pistacia atlantica TaxID=434234 RepID=A0ACC1BH79_9ROSI|nr:hypothetical protein Patl1_20086 [Pistacia atlantica]
MNGNGRAGDEIFAEEGVSSQERTACGREVFAGLCRVSGSGIDSVDQRVA